MNIQWYPGHMTKARRMMQEDIKLIDIVIELVDARLPLASKNPDIDDLAKGKARLIRSTQSFGRAISRQKDFLYFRSTHVPVPV